MKFAQSGFGNGGSFTRLWTRAPWWRFVLMSSALLTLLCILFPPNMASNTTRQTPAILNEASYTPPSVPKNEPPPMPAAEPKTAAAASLSHKPNVQAAQVPTATPSLGQVAKASPKVAELSLATPSNRGNSKDPSGLDAAVMGRTYHDSLLANGFKVPLPPGNWVMLANSSIKIINDPANTGTNYFLGRIEHKRLVGAVIIYAMRSPGSGFARFDMCDPPDLYLAKEEIIPFDHQACWLIHSYFTPPWQQWADKTIDVKGITRAAAGDLAAKGVTYPQDLVSVHFFRSEKWGLLNVSYLYSPENEGITSNIAPTFRDADWFVTNIQKYPEKIAYVNKLKNWGDPFWLRFKAAFAEGIDKDKATAGTEPPPHLNDPQPQGSAPKISRLYPENRATAVPLDTTEIVVEFDQPMQRTISLLTNCDDGVCYRDAYWKSDRTLGIKVKLLPDHEYRLGFGNEKTKAQKFLSINGIALPISTWTFRTASQ